MPLWKSPRFCPSSRFSRPVSSRLARYLRFGIPPRRVSQRERTRLPSTMSQMPNRIGRVSASIIRASYWPSGCTITTMSASIARAAS